MSHSSSPVKRFSASEVRVVGHHEHAIAGDRRRRGWRCRRSMPVRPRPLEVPDLPPAAGVERDSTRSASVTYMMPPTHDRRALRAAGAGNREHPFRRQPLHVGLVDLRQRRVAVAARIAVVGRPVGLGRHFAEPRRRPAAAGARACRRSAAADRRSLRRAPGRRASAPSVVWTVVRDDRLRFRASLESCAGT